MESYVNTYQMTKHGRKQSKKKGFPISQPSLLTGAAVAALEFLWVPVTRGKTAAAKVTIQKTA